MHEDVEIPARRSNPYQHRKNFWWIRVKPLIQRILQKYPAIYAVTIKIWRTARFVFLKSRWRLDALIGSRLGSFVSHVDADKIYWIPPHRIVFSAMQEFSIHNFRGRILGGDWDRLEKRFDDLDIYIAIKQVCLEGGKWDDTLFYQRELEDLEKSRYPYIHKDENALKEHCKQFESLYHRIQHDGYISQKELFLAGEIQDPKVAEEEVTVSIGRYGDLLFSDGAHRLAIAKIQGLPAIPVKIAVRHEEWIKFRRDLLSYARDSNKTKDETLYQPVLHPDLMDLPAFHPCENRFQVIKEHTSFRQGLLLDIGANLGYFCHRFEEVGLDCYAVENDPSTIYFLKRLARAENRKFRIITESVFDSLEIRATHFNIVLALNILHHFLKTREDYEKLVDLLKSLQTDELFFESHHPDGYQMQGAYRNYSSEEFIEFIASHTGLNKSVFLGTMLDGRPLYKLSK